MRVVQTRRHPMFNTLLSNRKGDVEEKGRGSVSSRILVVFMLRSWAIPDCLLLPTACACSDLHVVHRPHMYAFIPNRPHMYAFIPNGSVSSAMLRWEGEDGPVSECAGE
jgi:hypothetical protein